MAVRSHESVGEDGGKLVAPAPSVAAAAAPEAPMALRELPSLVLSSDERHKKTCRASGAQQGYRCPLSLSVLSDRDPSRGHCPPATDPLSSRFLNRRVLEDARDHL